jgi:hypothetical protein
MTRSEVGARYLSIVHIFQSIQTATMVLLFFLLAAGSADISDQAIAEQAKRCGLKPDQLVWTVDAQGRRRAHVTPNGELDRLPYKSLVCMLRWATKSGARVGFISEPAPTPEPQPDRAPANGP